MARRCDTRHPHIVHTSAIIETSNYVYIVMELLEGGDLQSTVCQRGQYNEADAATVMLKLCSALEFLHNQGADRSSGCSVL